MAPNRSKERIPKLLARLQKMWEQYPGFRLGQIISLAGDREPLHLVEDEKLIKILERILKDKS